MFKRVLIANRGEIAARIARTCKRLGVEYVCVYSDVDSHALYLKGAYTSIALGAPIAIESYLNQSKIIAAALDTQCQAIHPGYGFLSENADFARAVEDAGLTFIGPNSDTIEILGDKARAKVLMHKAEVPTIPGSDTATEDIDQVIAASAQTGFPLLLKPTAGGGGKGMRIVYAESELREAAAEAIRLARANFNNGGLLVEKYVENPRHIEVQVFGDKHGSVVHLFERECSLQRRHQKVLEEAPATSISAQTANRLREASVRGAKAVGYTNAGTFEFIVDKNEDFYFLEVNTRLQVEHPVTEEIVGLDLVEWQLRVAANEPLPLAQADIHASGHAMEVRVYAEDALNDFRPAPGTITDVRWPADIRVETAIEKGQVVSAFYDPMIAKLVSMGKDRDDALNALAVAVEASLVHGVTTNLGFLSQILADPNVKENRIHTRYLDGVVEQYKAAVDLSAAIACAAAIALPYWRLDAYASPSPWIARSPDTLFDRADVDVDAKFGRQIFWLDGDKVEAVIDSVEPTAGVRVMCGASDFNVHVDTVAGKHYTGHINGSAWSAQVLDAHIEVVVVGHRAVVEPYGVENVDERADRHSGTAPMPGIVVSLPVRVGDQVSAGTTLVVVEAMKMENHVCASHDGIVTSILCALGDNVPTGQVLVEVDPA